MKVLVLYREKSEHARKVEDFTRDFSKQHSTNKIALVDVDSRDGSSTASLYDVMDYPTILALTDDGQLLKQWQGDTMPLMDEVAYYARQ